jgi:hypothetical protein
MVVADLCGRIVCDGEAPMKKHGFCALVWRVALVAVFGFVPSLVLATGGSPMEGTWGGADAQGRTAQITVVGKKVIGVFWGQDYHDAENVRFSSNGARIDFTMDGAKAIFVRDPTRGRITVHETDGRVISIGLKKD